MLMVCVVVPLQHGRFLCADRWSGSWWAQQLRVVHNEARCESCVAHLEPRRVFHRCHQSAPTDLQLVPLLFVLQSPLPPRATAATEKKQNRQRTGHPAYCGFLHNVRETNFSISPFSSWARQWRFILRLWGFFLPFFLGGNVWILKIDCVYVFTSSQTPKMVRKIVTHHLVNLFSVRSSNWNRVSSRVPHLIPQTEVKHQRSTNCHAKKHKSCQENINRNLSMRLEIVFLFFQQSHTWDKPLSNYIEAIKHKEFHCKWHIGYKIPSLRFRYSLIQIFTQKQFHAQKSSVYIKFSSEFCSPAAANETKSGKQHKPRKEWTIVRWPFLPNSWRTWNNQTRVRSSEKDSMAASWYHSLTRALISTNEF